MQKNTLYIILMLMLSVLFSSFVYWQATHLSTDENYFAQSYLSAYTFRGGSSMEVDEAEELMLEAQGKYPDDIAGAIALYKRAAELDPENAYIDLCLGVLFLEEHQYVAAIEHFSKVYEDKSNYLHFDAAWFLALIHQKHQNETQAKALFKEVANNSCRYQLRAQKELELYHR